MFTTATHAPSRTAAMIAIIALPAGARVGRGYALSLLLKLPIGCLA